MRTLVLVATLTLAIPALGTAAPLCAPDSLAGYIALGVGGCEIGGATFSGFGSAPSLFGGAEIGAGAITVSPLLTATGPQLDFGLSASAGPSEILGVLIGYSVTGLSFTGADLSMAGSDATVDGAVTVVEDLCLEGSFGADPSICSGTPESLIVAHDFLGPIGPDSASFAASFFDVFVDITIDGGLLGSASLTGTVTNHFSAAPVVVPEPSALVLVGSGLLGIRARRRRRIPG